MRKALLTTFAVLALPLLACLACSKDESSGGAAASASAAPSAPPSAPVASASAPPSASAAPEPPHDCPPGSTGTGSFTVPCDAKGNSRMMESKWTKTTDDGPQFAVTNKGKLVILYGKIAVYFYDKAGKQLDVVDESVTPSKTKKFHTCSGSFFGGVMNPAEKELLNFSCVPKKVIPDGTVTIESEIPMVGFADSSNKKVDFYWRNNDLMPDVRPKGGVK